MTHTHRPTIKSAIVRQTLEGSRPQALRAAAISAASSASRTSPSPLRESQALKSDSRCAFSSSGERVSLDSEFSLMALRLLGRRAIARSGTTPNLRKWTLQEKDRRETASSRHYLTDSPDQ